MCKISKIKGLCNYIGNGNFEIFSEFQKIKNGWDCIGIWLMGKEKIINRCLIWLIKIFVFFLFCDRY